VNADHSPRLEVLDPGLFTTIQDHGRPGYAHLGVPPSGALDRGSHRLANRLVGNDPDQAVLETTMRGPWLRLRGTGRSVVIAVTGAPVPVSIDGRPVGFNAVVALAPGQILQLGTATAGLRSYLAIAGGFDVPPVLGSRSTDVLSGLGPPALAVGAEIAVGRPTGDVAVVDVVPAPGIGVDPILSILPGPRDDWFTARAFAVLTRQRWIVSAASNRIGLRLEGPALERRRPGELPSEGTVTGSIQVPPDGRPVVFLNDRPTTGGYPVIAVVTQAGLAYAAQAAPGTQLSFRATRSRARSVLGVRSPVPPTGATARPGLPDAPPA
jgi:biotin-dependent carboxylase-like uncharacterized protein